MNIWLLRHGEAHPTITTDEARNLTAHGREEVLIAAEQLKGCNLDIILHSPYARACQSADIIKDALNYQGAVEEVDWITPESDPKQVILMLDRYEGKNMLIVSHQPLLGYLVSLLVEGRLSLLSLKTAELLHLKGEYICMGGMQLKK